MAASPTRRDVLWSLTAAGAMAALGAPALHGLSFERRSGRVLIVDEGAFGNSPTPLRETFAAQGFSVYTTDFAEEGIELATLYDYDAVILGPRLSAQDRAWLQLALRMANIRTPVLAA